MTKEPAQPQRSWELAIRLFHWALVAVFAGSWITSELGTDYRDLHMQFGYVLLGLLIFRLIWGVIGGKHARFSRFPIAPKAIWRYLRSFASKDPQSVQGHNPLGAIMVIIMLAMLAVQVTSGLLTTDDIFYDGPYVSVADSDVVDTMSSLHHDNFDVLKWLVLLHIAAIVFYWFRKGTNLVQPMLSNALPSEGPSLLRFVCATTCAIGLALFVVYFPALSS